MATKPSGCPIHAERSSVDSGKEVRSHARSVREPCGRRPIPLVQAVRRLQSPLAGRPVPSDPADRVVPIVVAVAGYLLLLLAGEIGGDVVYVLGTHINRHAWRGAGAKWIALDLGTLPDIPQGGPTKLRAGINDLAVIREGDR